MSSARITTRQIRQQKGKTPVVCLTAYSAPFASILDKHCDLLLVGDSLGMVLYGMPSTLSVTPEMMAQHGKAVVDASSNACIVVDLPFGSYQETPQQAFRTAAHIMQHSGCSAVKLEGGEVMAETVAFLVQRGIPVMAHIGLMPQSVHALGGYRYQGRTPSEEERLMADAKAVENAGAFAVVLEGVTETIANAITENISIPTVGIGASPSCDGQVLVTEDMAGLSLQNTPRFVKAYANISSILDTAAQAYASDVRKRAFPAPEHCFNGTLNDAEKKANASQS